jgi:hypothetical protein
MFSFFRTNKDKEIPKAAPDSSPPGRMDLKERKTYRREMLYQAIRESLLSLEVVSSMYKFKVMNVDERHHRFIVMIDVTQSFQPHKSNRSRSFYDIEEFIKKNTFDRFGLILEGIYWRVSSSKSPFERKSREEDSPQTAAAILAASRKREVVGDVRNASQRLARYQYQPVSEEERKAFEEAIKKGAGLPVLHVGDREYQSERAPLDGGIMIGGTQYGKLEE